MFHWGFLGPLSEAESVWCQLREGVQDVGVQVGTQMHKLFHFFNTSPNITFVLRWLIVLKQVDYTSNEARP